MTTFFWLAVVTNRAILFEDDPKGKVLILSDFLQSKHIDWVMNAEKRTAMMDAGMPAPKRRQKDIEELFWQDDKRTRRKIRHFIDSRAPIVYLNDPWTAQVLCPLSSLLAS
jgi:hypothetical protein